MSRLFLAALVGTLLLVCVCVAQEAPAEAAETTAEVNDVDDAASAEEQRESLKQMLEERRSKRRDNRRGTVLLSARRRIQAS